MFEILTPGRTFSLKAASEPELSEWITHLRNSTQSGSFYLFICLFVYTTPKNPISADIWGGPFFFFFRV